MLLSVILRQIVEGVVLADDQSTQLVTVREVARHLNVDEKTVYPLAQRGSLPGFNVVGTWRFKWSDLDEWVDLRTRSGKASNRGEIDGITIKLGKQFLSRIYVELFEATKALLEEEPRL